MSGGKAQILFQKIKKSCLLITKTQNMNQNRTTHIFAISQLFTGTCVQFKFR